MPRSVLRVGTRGTALALAQAEQVRQAISEVITHRNFELVPVRTEGDDLPAQPPKHAPRGLFTRALQVALASGKIDLAVHNAANLATRGEEGVHLAAITKRDDPREAIITRTGARLNALPAGTTVAVTWPSERAQLLALGRGLDPVVLRAPLDQRLRDLSEGDYQAVVVPVSGLRRLSRDDRVSELIPISTMLPVPGQGAIAVECRSGDKLLRPAIEKLEDPASRAAVEAERSFASALAEDDIVPIAALAEAGGDRVRLRGLVASWDGRRVLVDQIETEDPEKAGIELADRLRAQGAVELILS